jgi:hypothetical protein
MITLFTNNVPYHKIAYWYDPQNIQNRNNRCYNITIHCSPSFFEKPVTFKNTLSQTFQVCLRIPI